MIRFSKHLSHASIKPLDIPADVLMLHRAGHDGQANTDRVIANNGQKSSTSTRPLVARFVALHDTHALGAISSNDAHFIVAMGRYASAWLAGLRCVFAKWTVLAGRHHTASSILRASVSQAPAWPSTVLTCSPNSPTTVSSQCLTTSRKRSAN